MSNHQGEFVFGTKAETLSNLRPIMRLAKVLPIFYFNVGQWITEKYWVLNSISQMGDYDSLIIRSSAQNEDGFQHSMAGAFTSLLNVPSNDQDAVVSAIQEVIGSFGSNSNINNQVLIQPMLSRPQMSGVVMTHDLQHGAPYYVINYDDESGRTDTITGGTGVQKTVLIYRNTDPSIFRSSRIQSVLAAVKELESICSNVPLDIEFAVDDKDDVYIFQVRRITLYNTWHPVTERRVARQLSHVQRFISQLMTRDDDLFGATTLLGVMPDWNPAEIIGTAPRPLAISLYRKLITDSAWSEARSLMGYHHPQHKALMVVLGSQPYIDVRNSFNSFLPAGLDDSVSCLLVNAWLDRLKRHPEYHDKVEFEIVQTCYDFNFEKDFENRYSGVLSSNQFDEYTQSLKKLTENAILGTGVGSLFYTLELVNVIAQQQDIRRAANCHLAELGAINRLLIECRRAGTVCFSILARHAFIAEAMLRSASSCGAITRDRLQVWKQSFSTITTELTSDYAAVCNGSIRPYEFFSKFGHLRPGTYDITSLRYDERHDLFSMEKTATWSSNVDASSSIFTLSSSESDAIQQLIDARGWALTTYQLFEYAKLAIQAREYAKFIFTKDLSDALLLLVRWGVGVGLSRDDLSYLDISSILDLIVVHPLDDMDRVLLDKVDQAKKTYQQSLFIKLGHLITSVDDVFVVPLHRSMPNFVTHKCAEGACIRLKKDTPTSVSLNGKVVFIENADPGYDWIFTRDIAGLVTQFGGANSHMAIRCAEFGIPAAIGCGEQLFNKFKDNYKIILNCKDKTINMV
ncbi:PEP/pyruvate-binding domain-containing protein [Aeromonas veronii]|uniref:PEP/pyruvate-binding domain-containing protein n=1 Tax=Aeromonas veronii TaxID=654 RepID=UPI00226CD612|nr:PEP/pyruvate-binding domain-containing protein [Aeromonas veronii]MCX9103496.1 PEP-utilizing enzyme [Aeromonas veronii]MCX9119147.1 PEP-utilizing enzyme [Aeromonas veronii]